MPVKIFFGKTLSGQGKSNEAVFLSAMEHPLIGVPNHYVDDR
jgi:hypothetical protein